MTTEKTHWFDRENDPVLKKADLVDECAPEAAAVIKEVDDQIERANSLLRVIEDKLDHLAMALVSWPEIDNTVHEEKICKLADDLKTARNLLSEAPTLEALEALEVD